METYDLIVIGAGSGGLSMGLTMHELGFRVLLIDKTERAIGGECLNDGCIPSKALIHVTRQLHQARLAQNFGLKTSGDVDFERVKAYVQQCIGQIRTHENADYFRQQGLGVVIGTARFTDKNSVDVAGKAYSAKRIVIATGSHAVRLDVPGIEQIRWYDNTGIFTMPDLPKRLLVVGGGPIAMELSQAFARLGARVTVVQEGERILEKELPDVSALLMNRLTDEGIDFQLNTKLTHFTSATEAVLQTKNGAESTVDFDTVLVAIGRKIDVSNLNPEAAGIETEDGKLKLNKYLQTTNPNVYAIGDVSGQLYFSHTPEMQAPILANNFMSPLKQSISYKHFSWVTFTDPEVATFGQTEDELKKQGVAYDKLVYDFAEDDRAVTDNYTYGKQWLFLEKGSNILSKRRILGGTIVAPHAGEMIQDLILANTNNMGASTIRNKTYPYPVASRVSKSLLTEQLKQLIPGWGKKILRWLY